jgi:hypothetical protein
MGTSKNVITVISPEDQNSRKVAVELRTNKENPGTFAAA